MDCGPEQTAGLGFNSQLEQFDLPVVALRNAKVEIVHFDGFIDFGHAAKGLDDNAAYGVEFLVTDPDIEKFIEILNGCQGCLLYTSDAADE